MNTRGPFGRDARLGGAGDSSAPGCAVAPRLETARGCPYLVAYLVAYLAAYLVAFHPQELPPAVIDRISDQIARLSGTEPPALQQERREIVYSWHRNETLKRRQDGRQEEGGRDMLRPASQGSLPVSAGFDRTR